MKPTFDVAVVGAGPAGLCAALAFAVKGKRVALIGPMAGAKDTRTTALLTGTVAALDAMGAWAALRDHASPLKVMRILDGTERLWRAPPVEFDASEIGLDAFGWNIENHRFNDGLASLVAASGVERIETPVSGFVAGEGSAVLNLFEGRSLEARLIVAADGRNSTLRDAAGISVKRWTYPQTAVTLAFSHSRPHRDVSTEFHTETGPFTLVPLAGNRSSLVFVETPERAESLLAMSDEALSTVIEKKSRSILGKVTVEAGRSNWPLSGLVAERLNGPRLALVGEAAHAFPPIGAQGFNLTMRDVVALARILGEAEDPGDADRLQHYERERRVDIVARTNAVDLLNRSLLTDFLPVQAARGLGLFALDRVGPIRRMVMRQGLAGGAGQ